MTKITASADPDIRDEELAGPPRVDRPITRQDRISAIDILRGFALLGIFILNVDGFALPLVLHDIPVGIPKPAFTGPHSHLSYAVLYIKFMLFEGRMRSIFEMLFGAGTILITSRLEKRGGATSVADIYLRRNFWLFLIGMIHCVAIWTGDILYNYAIVGVVLYTFRNMRAKHLVWSGITAIAIYTASFFYFFPTISQLRVQHQAQAILVQKDAGAVLSPEQKKIVDVARKSSEIQQSTLEQTKDLAEQGYSGYFDQLGGWSALSVRTHWLSVGSALDELATMLFGMALFRIGFLQGDLSRRTYLRTAAICLPISMLVSGLALHVLIAHQFNPVLDILFFAQLHLPLEVLGALGISALLLYLIKADFMPWLMRRFAAVGQTALTNYLLTSLIGQTIFFWGPWKLYGQLEYVQVQLILPMVWAINLVVSPLWLRAFAFGPVEWLWRSLTYWKLQPMRLRS